MLATDSSTWIAQWPWGLDLEGLDVGGFPVDGNLADGPCGAEVDLEPLGVGEGAGPAVVRLPSVTLEAGQLGPFVDDAVGWCNARFVVPQEAAAALPALMVAADRSAAATLSVAMTMPATRQREREREAPARQHAGQKPMGVLGLRLAPWSGSSAATAASSSRVTSLSRQFEFVLF
jgi:hypothetical protein